MSGQAKSLLGGKGSQAGASSGNPSEQPGGAPGGENGNGGAGGGAGGSDNPDGAAGGGPEGGQGGDQGGQGDNANNSGGGTGAAAGSGDQGGTGGGQLVDEASVLEFLRTKKGLTINSLDEFRLPDKPETDEEKAERERIFRDKARAFGLENGDITNEDVDSFAADRAKPARDIAFALFAQELREEDADISDADITARFQEYYGELEEEGTWKRSVGARKMQALADSYLKDKYGKVLSVDDKYRDFLGLQDSVNTYRTQIESAVTSVPAELSFEVDNTLESGEVEKKKYTFKPTGESLSAVKEQLLSSDMYRRLGQGGLTQEQLNAAVYNAVLVAQFPQIVNEVARSHVAEMKLELEAKRKVIPLNGNHLNGSAGGDVPVGTSGHGKAMLKSK